PHKHQAIDVTEGHSPRCSALQHVELVSKKQDFRLKPCFRPDQPGQRTCQQPEKVDHRVPSPDSRLLASRRRFPVGTGLTMRKITATPVLSGLHHCYERI